VSGSSSPNKPNNSIGNHDPDKQTHFAIPAEVREPDPAGNDLTGHDLTGRDLTGHEPRRSDRAEHHLDLPPLWIAGGVRSGKTQALIERGQAWLQVRHARSPQADLENVPLPLQVRQTAPPILVLAASGDNRIQLSDRLAQAFQDTPADQRPALHVTTPIGFFEQEVLLFWSILTDIHQSAVLFPLRLQSETEQELATALWQSAIETGDLQQVGVSPKRMVRRILDVLQLCTVTGVSVAEIAARFDVGLPQQTTPELNQAMQAAAAQWQTWSLAQGLLTYSTIAGLYQALLQRPLYQERLLTRFSGLLADDLDEFPPITRGLVETFLAARRCIALTFNPDVELEPINTPFDTEGDRLAWGGGIRRGINANPQVWLTLADQCECLNLTQTAGLGDSLSSTVLELIDNPFYFQTLPAGIAQISTVSRSQLLRRVAEEVAQLIQTGKAQPHEIAIIAPGLDAVSRYAITTILEGRQIASRTLNVQRPLIGSPRVRAVLTLLALVYELGDLLDRDAIAEMLTVLSPRRRTFSESLWATATPAIATGLLTHPPDVRDLPNSQNSPKSPNPLNSPDSPDSLDSFSTSTASTASPLGRLTPDIDPVRAGMIADFCYRPDRDHPELQPIEIFRRRDRLGYRAVAAYENLRQWLADVRQQCQNHTLADAQAVLHKIIQDWLWLTALPYDAVAELRTLLESAQHYWKVQTVVRSIDLSSIDSNPIDSNLSDSKPIDPNSVNPNPRNPKPTSRNSDQGAAAIVTNEAGDLANDFSEAAGGFFLPANSPTNSLIPRSGEAAIVDRFVRLLQSGVVAADPFPVRSPLAEQCVLLSNIFQYRSTQQAHRWQFWLDVGSPLWAQGGTAELFGAPLFLADWQGETAINSQMTQRWEKQRLRSIVRDLLARCDRQIILCYSEMDTTGADRIGALSPLVDAAVEWHPLMPIL